MGRNGEASRLNTRPPRLPAIIETEADTGKSVPGAWPASARAASQRRIARFKRRESGRSVAAPIMTNLFSTALSDFRHCPAGFNNGKPPLTAQYARRICWPLFENLAVAVRGRRLGIAEDRAHPVTVGGIGHQDEFAAEQVAVLLHQPRALVHILHIVFALEIVEVVAQHRHHIVLAAISFCRGSLFELSRRMVTCFASTKGKPAARRLPSAYS